MATCSSVTGIDAPVAIRPAAATDIAAVTRIYAREVDAGTSSYEIDAPCAEEMERRWRSVVDEGYAYLVADCAGRTCGFAYAGPYRARAGYRWTVENSVYVDSAYLGRGIGRALLQALIDACAGAGYRQMIAVVGDGSNQASIRLHEALGFRVAGRFPGIGWKNGRWLEGVQLVRPLGPGMSTPPGTAPLPLQG